MNVLVAMSGGVDSSVAAALLRDAGHDVAGVTLRLWGGETDSGCCSVGDVEDARRVAAQLGIDHYVFNLADDFATHVVSPYVADHHAGATPNPCVECNRSIKFGVLLDRAVALGFDALATGHHARVREDAGGRYSLLRGVDPAKDQSYVLYMLSQRELARTVLPIGHLTKMEVRAHAARLGLRTADKPESMDVCFVRREERHDFVMARTDPVPGVVVDGRGSVLASHRGIEGFTIGQRRGLGVATGERRYVVAIDASTATVTIGTRDELLDDHLQVRDLAWVDQAPAQGATVLVQARAHGAPVAGRLHGDVVRLHERMPRVAPGQVVALYDLADGGALLLGGGIAA
jgi:tRNA-uridine 2-sulfurtransferase